MAVWWVAGTLGGLVVEAVLIIVLGRRTTSRWERTLDERIDDEPEPAPRTRGRRASGRRGRTVVLASLSGRTTTTRRAQGASAGQR